MPTSKIDSLTDKEQHLINKIVQQATALMNAKNTLTKPVEVVNWVIKTSWNKSPKTVVTTALRVVTKPYESVKTDRDINQQTLDEFF